MKGFSLSLLALFCGVIVANAYIVNLFDDQREQPNTVELVRPSKPIDLVSPAQCWVYVAGNSSSLNGLDKLWENHQPELQKHVDGMKQCRNLQNEILVALCIHDTGFKFASGMLGLVHQIEAVNLNVTKEITRNFKTICHSSRNVSETLPQQITYMKCVAQTVSQILVADSELEELALQLKNQFTNSVVRLQACTSIATGWEANICTTYETEKLDRFYEKFMSNLYANEYSIYSELVKALDKSCY